MMRLSAKLVVAVVLASPAALGASEGAQPERPNIVLIISDDQGAGDYGFQGHPHVQTTHLDQLADARRQQKPFFVWYAPFMPHTPHTPPDRLFRKYATKTPSPHVARYWAMCEWLDETCGELLGYLEREKLAENTIVVYLADNGWVQSPDRAAFAPKNKTTPFDLGHRTPLLIRWPARVKPARSESLAASIDIVPTLLAAVGAAPPAELPGVNLLDGRSVAARKQVLCECFTVRAQTLDDPAANLRWRWTTDGRWRLIVPRTYQATGALARIPSDS